MASNYNTITRLYYCILSKSSEKCKELPSGYQEHFIHLLLSQIRYSLVVILELNGVSEVQYKDVIMIDDGKY